MVEQGLGKITKLQHLVRATKDGELWSDVITNVLKVHNTDKTLNISETVRIKYLLGEISISINISC